MTISPALWLRPEGRGESWVSRKTAFNFPYSVFEDSDTRKNSWVYGCLNGVHPCGSLRISLIPKKNRAVLVARSRTSLPDAPFPGTRAMTYLCGVETMQYDCTKGVDTVLKPTINAWRGSWLFEMLLNSAISVVNSSNIETSCAGRWCCVCDGVLNTAGVGGGGVVSNDVDRPSAVNAVGSSREVVFCLTDYEVL